MDNKQCMCKNLSTLIDMVDLFNEIGGEIFKQHPDKGILPKREHIRKVSAPLQRDRAATLVDKLTNIISEKDTVPYRLDKSTIDEMLKTVRKYRREYDEKGGPETIFALDSIRALIHSDEGIRAKLLCQKECHSKENGLLYDSMQALRGVAGNSNDAKRITRDLYKDTTCINIFGERK